MVIKVLVTKFCIFLPRLGTVTNLCFFVGFKKIFKTKSHHITRGGKRLSLGGI